MTLPLVVFPRDSGTAQLIGGKACALAEAGRGGLPVPPWFALTIHAFADSLGETGQHALLGARDDADVQRIVGAIRPSPAVQAALRDAVAVICPSGQTVAVRSSAAGEDGATHSFAGQLESFLSIAPADVERHVRAVWLSGFSARLLAYRRELGLTGPPEPPAVLVQRMVPARAAGVAFSADPVSGRRGIAVVSAVAGLGDVLVSGLRDADTWLVDRRGTIVERRLSGSGGTPVLNDAEVGDVAAVARASERLFGRPQDVEWAYEGGDLHLLQTRPITSIAALPDPDGVLTIWDNSNLVESYSGVTTPLTFSFAAEIYEHVYREFCRLMRVPERVIAEQDDTFRNMLGLVRGRMYYNLLNWYRVLALLPGYRTNRRFMEQMMGVREPLPDALSAQVAGTWRRGALADVLHQCRTVLGLVASYFTLERRVRAFSARLADALQSPEPPLTDRRADELVAHYRDLRRRLLLHWDAPLVNDFFAMIFYGLLRTLTRRWCGEALGGLENDLVGGQGGMLSAEPAMRLHRLATLAMSQERLVECLTRGTLDDIQEARHASPAFEREFAQYLDRFGERTVNELKLESLTHLDDPLPLLRAIGQYAARLRPESAVDPSTTPTAGGPGFSPATTAGEALRADSHRRILEALAGHPLRRAVFAWVLRRARRGVRDRENLRLERTRLFGRVRRIVVELGKRFHADGVLDDPRDVFYVEMDEILSWVEGRATSTNLRRLSAVRRAEFEAYERGPAPDDWFETRGAVHAGHDFTRVTPRVEETGDERRGLGCSPGIVRGPVRVVRDPRTVQLETRTILVAEHTDPGWILVFPSARAVLVERGSLLSHAAIVARELGIPAVVSLPGLTRWLKDGDLVELDGTTGIVRRLPGTSV